MWSLGEPRWKATCCLVRMEQQYMMMGRIQWFGVSGEPFYPWCHLSPCNSS